MRVIGRAWNNAWDTSGGQQVRGVRALRFLLVLEEGEEVAAGGEAPNGGAAPRSCSQMQLWPSKTVREQYNSSDSELKSRFLTELL